MNGSQERSQERILYDNNKYRDESKVKRLNQKVVATTVVFLVLWSAAIFLLDFILSQGLETNGLWVRITVDATLVVFVGYAVAHNIYTHVKSRDAILRVTERGIVMNGRKKGVLEFSRIEMVTFSKRFVEIRVTNQGKKPGTYLLESQVIWNIRKFRDELSNYCNVESQ